MWSSSTKGSSDKAIYKKYKSEQNLIRCSDAAAQFIHDQLSGDWNKGGGGLIVQRQLPT